MHSKEFARAMSMSLLIAATAFAILAVTAQSSAQTMIRFDVPGAGTDAGQGTVVRGINTFGTITGVYITPDSVQHGFVRLPGAKDKNILKFDSPGAGTQPWHGTVPQAINIMGAVVGFYINDANETHGFLRAWDGKITALDAPDAGTGSAIDPATGSTTFFGTFPETINDFGEIGGYYIDVSGIYHGFVRDPRGKITEFDAPGAGTNPGQGTRVNFTCPSMNLQGTLADFIFDSKNANHGYLRTRNGKFTTLDAPGMTGTIPSSINTEGVVSAICVDDIGNWHGCVRNRNDKWEVYEVYPPADVPWGNDWTFTTPEQINNFGVVTGYTVDPYPNQWILHGFTRTRDGKITVIDAGTATGYNWPAGTEADVINDLGVVAGTFYDDNVVNHGWVWLPK